MLSIRNRAARVPAAAIVCSAILASIPGAAAAAPPNGTYSGGPDVAVDESWVEIKVQNNRIVSADVSFVADETCDDSPTPHLGTAWAKAADVPIVNGSFSVRNEVHGFDPPFSSTIVTTLSGEFNGPEVTGTLKWDRADTGPGDFVLNCSIGPVAWTAINADPQPAGKKKCKKGFKRVKGKCKRKRKKRRPKK